MQNLSKNIVEIAKNDVEKYCRIMSNYVEICRKMRNLSKNAKFVEKWCRTVEMAKNVVEKYCRIMSNYVEIGLNCEICRKILSKSRKMMSKSIEMAKFVEICRKRVFGFLPLYKERKAIHVVGPGALRRLSKTCFRIFPPHMKKEKSFILREVYQKITRKISIKIIKWGIKS